MSILQGRPRARAMSDPYLEEKLRQLKNLQEEFFSITLPLLKKHLLCTPPPPPPSKEFLGGSNHNKTTPEEIWYNQKIMLLPIYNVRGVHFLPKIWFIMASIKKGKERDATKITYKESECPL